MRKILGCRNPRTKIVSGCVLRVSVSHFLDMTLTTHPTASLSRYAEIWNSLSMLGGGKPHNRFISSIGFEPFTLARARHH